MPEGVKRTRLFHMPSKRTVTIQIPRFTAGIDHIQSTASAEAYALDENNYFEQVSNMDEFNNAKVPAYYMANDNTLHIKADVPTDSPSAILIANSPSAISSIAADNSNIMLEYSSATGVFSYAMPSGMSDACIKVYDVTGMATDLIGGLTADGTVRQTSPTHSLSGGMYLATLHARNADGSAVKHTVKIGVR